MATPSLLQLTTPLCPELASTPPTPQQLPSRDLRSDSIPLLRAASEGSKYNQFKCVKRGDLGQKFLVPPDYHKHLRRTTDPFNWFTDPTSNLLDWEAETWTKRDLYIEARSDPGLPRRHHSCQYRLKAHQRAKSKSKLVLSMKDELVSAMRYEHCVPEEAWDQSVLNMENDNEGPEWCWDHTRARNDYRGQAVQWKGIPAISEVEMQGRRNEAAGALVDGAVWRWEEGRRREEDRIFAHTWETLSEGDDMSNDGWADD
ncbi:hypothetical protein MMC17_008549 [Xylographa soralifera]|nr:hypothetical protein [Xylographa soralifera]